VDEWSGKGDFGREGEREGGIETLVKNDDDERKGREWNGTEWVHSVAYLYIYFIYLALGSW
jgi:hypothetical protein